MCAKKDGSTGARFKHLQPIPPSPTVQQKFCSTERRHTTKSCERPGAAAMARSTLARNGAQLSGGPPLQGSTLAACYTVHSFPVGHLHKVPPWLPVTLSLRHTTASCERPWPLRWHDALSPVFSCERPQPPYFLPRQGSFASSKAQKITNPSYAIIIHPPRILPIILPIISPLNAKIAYIWGSSCLG
jgi:hypothetical protein